MSNTSLRSIIATIALASAGAAAAHPGHDGGAHHGVFQELAHGLESLDPLLVSGLIAAAAIGVVIGVARLLRGR
ncbi:hypothetical protein M6I34_15225 [Burkholderiaceae bacterium FT117]|uniref:hypothetical protein n=1 Tax=Zeimonas sediminis TaxID=2944268 RepID=UPI002342ED92|nr:hypothetical protein [Zeimonas sediminis]MCM5571870.1 hypothetical protein [Zeimonas sediminis]